MMTPPEPTCPRRQQPNPPGKSHQSVDELLTLFGLDSTGDPLWANSDEPCLLQSRGHHPDSVGLVVRTLRSPQTQPIAGAVRLSSLVHDFLDMDAAESALLLALADERVLAARSAEAFHMTLMKVINARRLSRLFTHGQSGEHHRGIVPGGYSERTGEVFPPEMAAWRADFRAMAPEQQMLAATIVWLYQSGPDSTWLRRVPCTWSAVEAIRYMRDADCIADWLRLIALCPGW